jgi:hypothetical protein
MDVEIKIPLVGGVAEKKALQTIEATWHKFDALVDTYVNQ